MLKQKQNPPHTLSFELLELRFNNGDLYTFILTPALPKHQNHSPSYVSFNGLRPLITTKAKTNDLSPTNNKRKSFAIKAELSPSIVITLSTEAGLFTSTSNEKMLPSKGCLSRTESLTLKQEMYVLRNMLALMSNDSGGFNIVDVLAWGSIGHIVAYYILATTNNGYDPKFF